LNKIISIERRVLEDLKHVSTERFRNYLKGCACPIEIILLEQHFTTTLGIPSPQISSNNSPQIITHIHEIQRQQE
jgi:hypothetical protein